MRYLKFCLAVLPHHVRIEHLKVDTHSDLVIDTVRPHFSWKLTNEKSRSLHQIAYQLQIESVHDISSKWDSGRIESDQSIHVPYMGPQLKSNTKYVYRLKYWTNTGTESEWTQGTFRTTIFNPTKELLMNADISWIGSTDINMNELRKEFQCPDTSPIRSATAFISGIGYYELYVNGDNVDPSRKLDPGWTTYEKRTLLVSFDLKNIIKAGANAIGVKLGNGWYSQEQYVPPSVQEPGYGPPRLLFVLHIIFENSDEFVVYSDQTWQGRAGSIFHDSVYNGEMYDSRNDRMDWTKPGFTDPLSAWITPMILPPPVNVTANGQITLQQMDPIRAGPDALHIETGNTVEEARTFVRANEIGNIKGASIALSNGVLKPISVANPSLNTLVFDIGQNFAGWCRFKLRGSRGLAVYFRYAEILELPTTGDSHAYGNIYVDNLRGATQSDMYVLRGDPNGETYEPSFTVHGFRYVAVYGSQNNIPIVDVECPVVHSETTLMGNFTSTNPVINQIQHNIQWGQLSNIMSLPTDCPQRDERKGWMGDAALSVDEALYNFDLIKFYVNFLNLITDVQRDDGAVPDTVPLTFGIYPADPNWGTALPTVTWQVYRHYGDLSVLTTYYPNVRAYVEYVRTGYKRTGLVNLDQHYGDWVPPPPQPQTNPHLIGSFAFLHDVAVLVNMSQLLNYTADIEEYTTLYKQLSDEFHSTFYNSAGYYADGMQTADVLALTLPNVVPADLRSKVFEHLVTDIINRKKHFTTGIVGIANLFPLLSDNGQHDLALELISAIDYPSYGYEFNNPYENATTLWEIWDAPMEGPGMNSRNHIMYGSV
ncbi:unnamed protein product, partial [Didymodactylos carnosus]